MSEAPLLIRREDGVGTVVLNRPDKRNALDLTMRAAIAQAVLELESDAAISAIVVTGSDTVFAAGADLNLLVDKGAQAVADIDLGQYWAPVANSRKPTIAAVSGFALGAGCELAMMCDLIVADASARFGQPELAVGIIHGAGGTQRLVRAVGQQVASLMLMTGEMLTGERAFQLGWLPSSWPRVRRSNVRWYSHARPRACHPRRSARPNGCCARAPTWRSTPRSRSRTASFCCSSTRRTRPKACALFSRSANPSSRAPEPGRRPMSNPDPSSVRALTIGVIGAGTMGRGIVRLFAPAGHRLLCFDAMDDAAPKAVAFVVGMIERGVEKGRLSPQAFETIRDNIAVSDGLKGLAECDIVIEAIVEDLAVKRELFAALEDMVGAATILASNTSSLTVADIASACRLPERVAGLHFFNPVPLMKVAEVIAAVRTAPATVATLAALVEGAGHRAVLTSDQPGFLVNHAGRGLYTEGLAILEEQVASASEIDTILREAAGFRKGPFELLDLTGLDVSSKVMATIYAQFQQEPRFRPSSRVPPRVAAGLFGRKTGEGWYRYDDGKQVAPLRKPLPPLPIGTRVWIEAQAGDRDALAAHLIAAGAALVDEPQDDALLVIQPWGLDATTHCVALGLDAARCVALDPLAGLARHRTLMLTASTTPAVRDAAHALLAHDGAAVTVINDSPGFVLQRVLATIINIAAQIAQLGIASMADIEAAVQLGLGYPHGPLAWGDAIGGERVLTILRNMQALTGDPRYRPSPWLVRRVALGLSLLTPEAPR